MNRAKWIIAIVFAMLLSCIMYLFALNGRYTKLDDDYLFDKWTGTRIDCITIPDKK